MVLSDLWYANAFVYNLDVKTFQDSDGDGMGDFPGLTHRLGYLARLGVTCLWLQPFHPSPLCDDGYDVSDYYAVDPRLGSLGDIVVFLREARERGMRVIMDLVVNHCSIEHAWFRSVRELGRRSPFLDYFIWNDDPPSDTSDEVVFPGEQRGIWSFEPAVGSHYMHRFYAHQPDLNFSNPEVREEVHKIMGFWLELGVSGFRIDAAPFLIELAGLREPPDVDPHVYLKDMREFVSWRQGDAVLLAEANVLPEVLLEYFGDAPPGENGHRDEMHMLFNFWLNQHLFLALATGSAKPLRDAWAELPDPGKASQWANFLRNHDELDLGRLSERERNGVFRKFAPDQDMLAFGRGIRRRLPPMLQDERALRMATSLLMALPGTPVLRYGEEIGMGDDLRLEGRLSVRTPMQWSDGPNAGFSSAPPERLVRPVVTGGDFGFEEVNVAAQRSRNDSLLALVQRLASARKECPEFGRGKPRTLDAGNAAVFAHASTWNGRAAIALHNLGPEPAGVDVRDPEIARCSRLDDLLGNGVPVQIEDGGRLQLELEGFGFRWLLTDGAPGGPKDAS